MQVPKKLPNLSVKSRKSFRAYSPAYFSKMHLAAFGLVFAGLGSYIIFHSFAATISNAIEPENGTIATPATVITDVTASGGKGVQFGGSVTSSCALPAYPDASCTGVPAGTTLTPVNDNLTVTTNNSTVNAKDVKGCILVEATGVTIQNSRSECIWVNSGSVTVKDSEIDGGKVDGGGHFGTCVGPQNYTIQRSDIQGCENGFANDGNVTVEDSYIHDLYDGLSASGERVHTDGAEFGAGAANITYRHNTIIPVQPNGNGTSAINIYNDPGTQDHDITITQNRIIGTGLAWPIYCPRVSQATPNIYITNNRIEPGFGYTNSCTPGSTITTFSGNVDDSTGNPISSTD